MARKYVYWTSTALLCLLYVASATMYVMKGDAVRQALAALGYPAYLVPVLIAVKVLGVAAILSRATSRRGRGRRAVRLMHRRCVPDAGPAGKRRAMDGKFTQGAAA